jgi:hypothetical protein
LAGEFSRLSARKPGSGKGMTCGPAHQGVTQA